MLLRQDDPRKCSAAKMARHGLAKSIFRIRQIPRNGIVLNPFASEILLPRDKDLAQRGGVVAIDCSWERIQGAFAIHIPGQNRRLPTLLAGNPVNYAKAGKLSSVEAIASALIVMGFRENAARLLGLFKWGDSFMALNEQPLQAYSTADSVTAMSEAESQFF
jgi:pre-rRNA-processing protein TSR3